jgi:hypothetical protein
VEVVVVFQTEVQSCQMQEDQVVVAVKTVLILEDLEPQIKVLMVVILVEVVQPAAVVVVLVKLEEMQPWQTKRQRQEEMDYLHL